MITLIFPYPPKELNPNKKMHWAVKARYAKAYRGICKDIATSKWWSIPTGDLVLDLEFYPPDNRRRDDDNMIASFKNGRDGLAEALGIDDVRFQTRFKVMDKFKGGKVVVKIYKDKE